MLAVWNRNDAIVVTDANNGDDEIKDNNSDDDDDDDDDADNDVLLLPKRHLFILCLFEKSFPFFRRLQLKIIASRVHLHFARKQRRLQTNIVVGLNILNEF